MSNKGKKYKKLKGGEVATPENKERARDFLGWCAENTGKLRYYIRGTGCQVDEDLFSESMLKIHDAIAFKGTEVKDYTGYFLRTYRSLLINQEKKSVSVPLSLDIVYVEDEQRNDVSAEIMDFVCTKFPGREGVLFEIYVALLLSNSDTNIPKMFKIPPVQVWRDIARIRRAINYFFDLRAITCGL